MVAREGTLADSSSETPGESLVPGPRSRAHARRAALVECPAFGHRRSERPGALPEDSAPIVLARAAGCELFDVDGNRYLDFAAGFGSVLIGHGHPALKRAIREQSDLLIQGLGDLFSSDVKVALMENLAALHPSGHGQVLLTQSGSDAVAAALKTATLATGRHGFIAFDGAYHGLGFGPLAACGFQASFREPFAPQLNAHVRFCPYPGVRGASAEQALELVQKTLRTESIAGILVEPLMGRGGCTAPPLGFLVELGRLAHDAGALLIADEVWTGLGRAGGWLRSSLDGALADIVCLGKGLGGGLPISACVASQEAMAGWASGDTIHTSTHAGAPLGCAAALAVLNTLKAESLVAGASALGERVQTLLRARLGHPRIIDIRGAGLMIGIELDSARTALQTTRRLLRRGFLVVTGGIDGATLTLTPPLTMSEANFAALGDAIRECVEEP